MKNKTSKVGTLDNIFQRRGMLNGEGVAKTGKQFHPSSPTNCPNCNGKREWTGVSDIAVCLFCGRKG